MPRLRRWPLAILIVLASCGDITDTDISETGTVRFVDEDTPCWLIDTASRSYLPINLTDDFKVEGLRVRFEARRSSGSTICGAFVIELVSIERI